MRVTSPSAAPLALDALVALARLALPGVQVIDGPTGARSAEDAALIIGWTDGFTPAVVTTRMPPDLGGRAREEGDIVCVLDCYTGDTSFSALRGQASDILAALEQALRTQDGLGHVVDGAWIGDSGEWGQTSAGDGIAVRVSFAVHYVAEL